MDDISRDPDQEVRLPESRGAKGPAEAAVESVEAIDEAALAGAEPLGDRRMSLEPLRIERLSPDTARVTDERESDIDPRATLPVKRVSDRSHAPAQVAISLWPYLAAAAMLALGLEWCLWCMRRSSA